MRLKRLVYSGGVPHHVLFDNGKTVVVERDASGERQHRLHRVGQNSTDVDKKVLRRPLQFA